MYEWGFYAALPIIALLWRPAGKFGYNYINCRDTELASPSSCFELRGWKSLRSQNSSLFGQSCNLAQHAVGRVSSCIRNRVAGRRRKRRLQLEGDPVHNTFFCVRVLRQQYSWSPIQWACSHPSLVRPVTARTSCMSSHCILWFWGLAFFAQVGSLTAYSYWPIVFLLTVLLIIVSVMTFRFIEQPWMNKLEPVSKSPEEDNEAGELNKAKEVLGVVLPTDEDAPLPLYPSEQPLSTSQRRM